MCRHSVRRDHSRSVLRRKSFPAKKKDPSPMRYFHLWYFPVCRLRLKTAPRRLNRKHLSVHLPVLPKSSDRSRRMKKEVLRRSILLILLRFFFSFTPFLRLYYIDIASEYLFSYLFFGLSVFFRRLSCPSAPPGSARAIYPASAYRALTAPLLCVSGVQFQDQEPHTFF